MTLLFDKAPALEIEPLEMLSIAPCFDVGLGQRLVALGDTGRSESDSEGFILSATSFGILEQARSLFRVPDPIGRQLRQVVRENSPEVYRSALTAFLEVADTRMAEQLNNTFGGQGATVLRESFRLIVSDDPETQFEKLDLLLQENGERGRWADHDASARILSLYGDPSDRISQYLKAMSLWHRGQRAEASKILNFVIASSQDDKIAGVANHLQGTYLHSIGKTREAVLHLENARDILDRIGDQYGYSITTSTESRVLLDRYKSLRDADDLEQAETLAAEAIAASNEVDCQDEPRRCDRMKATALLGMANVRLQRGDAKDAITFATRASNHARSGSIDALRSHIVYARAMRDYGDPVAAAKMLSGEIASFAALGPSETRYKAIALNVLASIYRLFSLKDAAASASESLVLGNYIGDARHVAHTLFTIVQIELERFQIVKRSQLERLDELRRLKGLLFQAREYLTELNDKNGIARVADLLTELEGLQFSSRDLTRPQK